MAERVFIGDVVKALPPDSDEARKVRTRVVMQSLGLVPPALPAPPTPAAPPPPTTASGAPLPTAPEWTDQDRRKAAERYRERQHEEEMRMLDKQRARIDKTLRRISAQIDDTIKTAKKKGKRK